MHPDTPSTFDSFYDRDEPSFGSSPSEQLRRFIESTDLSTGRALDLGAGDGRNSLFLARCGFDVTAVDTSKVGLQKLIGYAQRMNLSGKIEAVRSDARTFVPPPDSFDLIVLVTILDHLPATDLPEVWSHLDNSLRPNGYLYIKVHTAEDPGATGNGDTASELSGHILHYFAPNELLRLAVPGYRIIRYEESEERDTTHGHPHQHVFARLLAQKLP